MTRYTHMNMERDGKREVNVLHNLSDCRNRVHDYANNVVPSLLSSLAEGFRLTNGCQLYQKDKDRLQAVLDAYDTSGRIADAGRDSKGVRAYIRSDEFDVVLEISDNYPVKYHNGRDGGYSCEYYKKTVYLWNNRDHEAKECKSLPLTTHHEMDTACVEAKEIEAEISVLQDKLYPLKRLIGR